MSPEMIAFVAVTGLTVLFALLSAAAALWKKDGLSIALLIGAAACLLFQYIALSFFLSLVDGAAFSLGVPAEGALLYGIQILSVALYETLFITLLFLILQKLVRYRFAVAFGVGYWCFFTLVGSVGDLVTMLSAERALFYGTAFEIVASGLQLPLQLPLYLMLSVSAALCVKRKKPGAFFFAVLLDVLFRCVLASSSVFSVPMLIALGFLVMLSLLYVYYVVKAKDDFPPMLSDAPAGDAELETDGEAEAEAVPETEAEAGKSPQVGTEAGEEEAEPATEPDAAAEEEPKA